MAAKHYAFATGTGGKESDASSGEVFTLDGLDIDDLNSFYCALGEAVNGPGGYFGASMRSLQDCCFGAFGATLPFTIRIENSASCRNALDEQALELWASSKLEAGDYWDNDGLNYLRNAIELGRKRSRSLLEEIMAILRSHGVRFELE